MRKHILLLTLTTLGFCAPAFAADTAKKPVDTLPKKDGKPCDSHAKKHGDGKEPCDHKDCMEKDHKHGMMHDGHNPSKKHSAGYRGMAGMFSPEMFTQSPMLNMARAIDITAEQQKQLDKLADDLRRDNWAATGSMLDEASKLKGLYAAEKRNAADIGAQYQKIFDLQRKMIETMINVENQASDVLTAEQRAHLKKLHSKMGPMLH